MDKSVSVNQSLLEDHPIFDWFEKNSRKILIIGLVSLSLLFLLYRYSSNKNSQAEQDYFQASNAAVLLKTPGKTEGALIDLQAILTRHPELHPRYDGMIAEELLVSGNLIQAKEYAQKEFDRIQLLLSSSFLNFSKNTFLIAENQKSSALKNAQELKQKMTSELATGSVKHFASLLYLFNLVRIANLQQELNMNKEAYASWEEFFQISKGKTELPISSQDFNKFVKHFEIQGVSLIDYVTHLMQKK